ncbi:DNA replication regulator dpb11, putative [Ricinus communis]|uniref:DNA replication regulator dpb11, putative n=1 Tax=Ricinus communis TaxID=3988 RepID=B9RNG3_RICCO|nr:DNA replication regulator dpb11, putative [Ricinus communis]
METASPSKTFLGVRFVLFGFDPINLRQVRAKLIDGGGVDAGQYNENCTHVIVDKIVYNDPICIAARNDRKTLVTGLWVDHSYDIGLVVDATSIMYRPLRDLNGIPGAKSLIMCLTGYQRQDRDDIMTMVSLMGAQFSKPLVANKVTHLICYKFEGEKYELANKLKKIKLVNHRWLEDCLRDWELLPEDNYSKSGYELEMMEAEAKDSEEDTGETIDKQPSRKMENKSPHLKIGTPKPCQLSRSTVEVPNMSHNLNEPEGFPSVANMKGILITPSGKNRDNHASGFDSNCIPAVPACQDARTSIGTSVGLPNPQERTPNPRNGDNDLETVSRSAERPYLGTKFSGMGYTRNTSQKSPSSVFSGESSYNRGSSKMQLGESINISTSRVEYANDVLKSSRSEDLQKGSELFYNEASSSKKQKMNVSCSNLGYQNVNNEAKLNMERSPSVSGKTQGLEPVSLVDGTNSLTAPRNHDCFRDDIVSTDAAKKLHVDVSTAKLSKLEKEPIPQGQLFSENATPGPGQYKIVNERTPQTSFKGLMKSSSASKSKGGDFEVEKSEYVVAEAGRPCHQQQDKQDPSPSNGKSEMEKSRTISSMEELQEGTGNLISKPGRKKTIAKRTLGSGPKSKNTSNRKGFIALNKAAAQNDPAVDLSGERANYEKSSNANELQRSTETVNVTGVKEAETVVSAKPNESETNYMDEETEALEDKDGHEDVLDDEKAGMVDLPHQADNMMEIEQEGAQRIINNVAGVMDDCSREETDTTHLQQKETCQESGVKGKVSKGRKQASGKTKKETVPLVSKKAESESAMKKEKGKRCSAGHSKSRLVSGKHSESSMEVEKENNPITDEDQNISEAKVHDGKGAKLDKVSMKIKQKSRTSNSNYTSAEILKHMKTEPVWFILSGHRLQRKEFQQVIRRLKGKFCRDSHQWSYQATHFIAPDPIRRTEKLFAAAASGRWILKTDYLTACSQAGRFLEEDPYEWHKNGLSEDGAINLEAPRKWRLLREKTGHGAFYGMRIIIYGECIAPPLLRGVWASKKLEVESDSLIVVQLVTGNGTSCNENRAYAAILAKFL